MAQTWELLWFGLLVIAALIVCSIILVVLAIPCGILGLAFLLAKGAINDKVSTECTVIYDRSKVSQRRLP